MLDSILYQCFVHPEICRQLVEAGLNVNTSFCYKMKGNDASLFSLAFDEDGYYTQAFKNLEHFGKIALIPAYQVKDMEKLLPDYLLSKTNTEYELNCSSLFQFEVEKNKRMPDAFAMMVLKAIRQKKIDVALANKKLSAVGL